LGPWKWTPPRTSRACIARPETSAIRGPVPDSGCSSGSSSGPKGLCSGTGGFRPTHLASEEVLHGLTDPVQGGDLGLAPRGGGGVGQSYRSLKNPLGVVQNLVRHLVAETDDFRDLAAAFERGEGLGGDDPNVLAALGPQVQGVQFPQQI